MARLTLIIVLLLVLLGSTLHTPAVQADDGNDDDEATASVQLTVNVVQPVTPTPSGGPTYTTTKTDYCGVSGSFLLSRSGRVLRTVTAGCKDGDLVITIEKDTIALDKDGKALRSLTIHEDADPPPLPEGDNFIGLPFNLGPSGA
ncbi:unnamed protein product, partial [marine sediment metagenome]